MKDRLRFRQIHLDFHTSGLIDGVGRDFDEKLFAKTLGEAEVDSVTCFARCHHGYLYYQSEKFPERIHPGLVKGDMLERQMASCREAGIKTPVYITVQWDHYSAKRHPEWLMRDDTGAPIGQKPLEAGFYGFLCVNTGYGEFLREQTLEVLEKLKPDGIFFDIVQTKPCCCPECVKTMEGKGFDPFSEKDRHEHCKTVLADFKSGMTELVHSVLPEASVFYNSGHISYETKETMDSYSHFELESLPGGEWGYMHFPVTMRYARNLGLDCLGHTGKFHTSWGDFHSFKNREALEYECMRMLALNAKCLIGDQLEPSGVLSPYVYSLIGDVYKKVKKVEPWCENAIPVTEVGVLSPDEFSGSGIEDMPAAMTGVARLLEQCCLQFDFIDSSMDFSKYRLVVMPDTIPADGMLAQKLDEYVERGGKVIASFESGMDPQKGSFAFSKLAVRVLKTTLDDRGEPVRGRFAPNNDFADYVLPEGDVGEGLNPTEYVMYAKGVEAGATSKGKAEIKAVEPYFNRSYRHFCSHRQAPSSGVEGYDAVVSTPSTVYFAHPVFTIYERFSPGWVKTMFANAVGKLLEHKLVSHDGPSCVVAALNRQGEKNRYALHMLSYIPEAKSASLDIIEDVIPLYDMNVELNMPEEIGSVSTVLGTDLKNVEIDGRRVRFTIPVLNGSGVYEITARK